MPRARMGIISAVVLGLAAGSANAQPTSPAPSQPAKQPAPAPSQPAKQPAPAPGPTATTPPKSPAPAPASGTATTPPAAPAAAGAPAASPPPIDRATTLYTQAEAAMDSGEYAAAASLYGQAFQLSNDPVLQFKIATAHDRAGDCTTALVHYQRYLAEGSPDAANTALTRERVQACEAKLAAAAEPPPAATNEPAAQAAASPADSAAQPLPSLAAEEPPLKRSAAWVSVGVSVAFLTAGAVLGLSASSREEDIENLIAFRDAMNQPLEFSGTTQERYNELVEEGQQIAGYSKLAFAAAGAAAITAGVLFYLDAQDGKDQRAQDQAGPGSARILPVTSADGVGVVANWRF